MATQRGFNAARESHAIGMRSVIRRFDNLAHRAAGRQNLAVRPLDLHASHDLRAGWQNEMELGRQSISHGHGPGSRGVGAGLGILRKILAG